MNSIMGYPSVDDLVHVAHGMARRHPKAIRLRRLGSSRAGDPLLLLTVGHGARNVLLVAGAHANEPVGGATSLRLVELLLGGSGGATGTAAGGGLLEDSDCSWHFLLCLDPDGSRLNEDWLHGLSGVREYFHGFYRPLFASQPEFLPAPGGNRRPLPESEILLALLDELRPEFQFTLHGSEMGGAFVQTTRAVPGLVDAVREVSAALSIPVDLRPFDGIDWHVSGPGVLVLPEPDTVRERDPSGLITGTTWLYPARYGTVTVILEAPAWAVEAVADPAPYPDPEKAIAEAGENLLQRIGQVAGLLALADEWNGAVHDPFLPAVRELVAVSPGVVETWLKPGFRYADGTRPAATRGSAAALLIAARRIALRAAAMLDRSLRAAPGPGAAKARLGLDDLLTEWCREFEAEFAPCAVPVRDQAELQARLALHCVARVLGPPPAGRQEPSRRRPAAWHRGHPARPPQEGTS
ncbi:M14 family zinc carboxypeptidase [Streptomyces johnsoniae]|uniref:M14 family zinc carboxypeptidase n=1 Tax=Streptomyces johnsoniae TaxID=3075532 RepID=A0ABU2S607_9ACTN|nr:M14 family zinc carboxypeptidase [Streptomyces sp. DSM 41886]MDT0443279.1 M14 family zinc carboxypeptidase [Streptomyces sp. DSM 41886]